MGGAVPQGPGSHTSSRCRPPARHIQVESLFSVHEASNCSSTPVRTRSAHTKSLSRQLWSAGTATSRGSGAMGATAGSRCGLGSRGGCWRPGRRSTCPPCVRPSGGCIASFDPCATQQGKLEVVATVSVQALCCSCPHLPHYMICRKLRCAVTERLRSNATTTGPGPARRSWTQQKQRWGCGCRTRCGPCTGCTTGRSCRRMLSPTPPGSASWTRRPCCTASSAGGDCCSVATRMCLLHRHDCRHGLQRVASCFDSCRGAATPGRLAGCTCRSVCDVQLL